MGCEPAYSISLPHATQKILLHLNQKSEIPEWGEPPITQEVIVEGPKLLKLDAVGYLRVSSKKQAESGLSVEAQIIDIKNYCAYKGLNLCAIYGDKRTAKNVDKRPGLLAVKYMMMAGKVQHVVVWKIDRGFRNMKDAVIFNEFVQSRGLSLHSAKEGFDLDTNAGELMFNIMSSLAHWDRRNIGENTEHALAVKKARGERRSRYAPIGKTFQGNKLVDNPTEKQAIMLALTLRARGLSYQKIALTLGERGFLNRAGRVYDPSTVQAMINSVQ